MCVTQRIGVTMKLAISQYREQKGMTQKELALAIGKSTRSIQQWESGDFYPTAKDLMSICEVLGCSPNEIFAWGQNSAPSSCELTESEQTVLDAINTLKEKGLI